MSTTVYDEHAAFYIDFVDRGLASGDLALTLEAVRACLGRIAGARICDVCCGEGYLGRYLLEHGAREVVGVDLSITLIDEAKRRAGDARLSYRVDDAHALASIADAQFDAVVSQLAMMDVPDHRRMFAAVRRVLKTGGAFVFSLLHPCFEGRPFHVTDAPPFVVDAAGNPVAYSVRRYASEGRFQSGGIGVRGRMGSYHRRLSTYVNDVLAAGFVLERLEEPLSGPRGDGKDLFREVPTVLVVAARAV
jgi:ubiquinone/menaquinone biosynthesis C-methylase UbiE